MTSFDDFPLPQFQFGISRSPTRPSNFAQGRGTARLARLCPTVGTKSSITAHRRDIDDAGSGITALAPTSTQNRYYRRRRDIGAKSGVAGAAATSTPNLALVGASRLRSRRPAFHHKESKFSCF